MTTQAVANFMRMTEPLPGGRTAEIRSQDGQRHAALTPVVVLGGAANALSVVRSLGQLGAPVYFLGERGSLVSRSRYCRPIYVDEQGDREAAWARWLLASESEFLSGSVLLACSDAGIRIIARNRAALLERYLLDLSNPDAQLQMLDKMATYRCAIESGLPTPQFWTIESEQQLAAIADQLVYPLLVKPRISHEFEARFGRKFILAQNLREIHAALSVTRSARIDVLLMEWIPGPDSQLCSYYTYLDEGGDPLFHFTKRIIRRYPVGEGSACYHITDWIPALVEPSLRLFARVGLRGLANVEYKLDPRDGQYKIIECNARFTASNCLVCDSGYDLARLVYSRLTGSSAPSFGNYRQGMRLWDPARDYAAFRDMRRKAQLGWRGWLGSIAHRQTFPFFRWSDPLPALARIARPIQRAFFKPNAPSRTVQDVA